MMLGLLVLDNGGRGGEGGGGGGRKKEGRGDPTYPDY